MKYLTRTAMAVLLFLAVVTLTIVILLRLSLPLTEGSISLSGLSGEVRIERDALGIPSIHARSRLDVAHALGFLHAQDRYFQMDLMRRAAAGELAELFGKEALEFDKERRIHQLRAVAKKICFNLSAEEYALLNSYTSGVNQGLQNLSGKPFEYFILQTKPRRWKPEDTILVGLSLFFELQDANGTYDLVRGYLKEQLSQNAYDFFLSNGSEWESALDGSKIPSLKIPPANDFLFTKVSILENQPALPLKLGGSNQWALAGSHSKTGAGLVACDMHLNFSVPNIWYRASFNYPILGGGDVKIVGATLPGTPLMAIGSNQHIAWGFTNGYLDTTDLVIVKSNPDNLNEYLTVNGPVPYERVIEKILVKSESVESLEIIKTIWGPISKEKYFGQSIAIQWIAHLPSCFNLRLIDLEKATSTLESLKIIDTVHLPIMNFTVADKEGHIGWKWIGGLPKRIGFDGSTPIVGEKIDALWKGLSSTSDYPKIIDPPSGYLWTANNRTLKNGSFVGQYLNGVRAHQIERRLSSVKKASPKDMLALQLDDEAFFFQRWQKLMLEVLNNSPTPQRTNLAAIVKQWDGHCSADSSAYFWIRTWRQMTYEKILQRLLPENSHFVLSTLDLEEPLWLLVSQKPSYLINPHFISWNDELISFVDLLLEQFPEEQTWGTTNTLEINHPFGKAFPFLDRWLNMSHAAVGGDYYVPYLNSPIAGASQRMAVSPGKEEEGIFHMPGGQSGHPFSAYYRNSHEDWLKGNPSPFLPGSTEKSLTLSPK
jgi:penicillin amidase